MSSLRGQWVQTNGPYGGTITCFALSPSSNEANGKNIFAGTTGGVFLSTNNGASWTSAGLTNNSINALVVDSTGAGSTNIFAGLTNGLYLSTNNGVSWTLDTAGLADTAVYALALIPNGTGGSNIFAGTARGMYLSVDNGASWILDTAGLSSIAAFSIAVSPNGSGGMNIFAATGKGEYRSIDNGATWSPVSSFKLVTISTLASSGMNLFAGTYAGGVSLSTDYGSSWTTVTKPNSNFPNSVSLIVSGSNLIAGLGKPNTGGGGGMYLSTDNGSSWSTLGPFETYVNALAAAPNGTGGANILAGTYGEGIFLSSDNGTNWRAVNGGLTNTDISSLAVMGTYIFAGTVDGIFLSFDDGTSWKLADSGLYNKNVQALAALGPTLFASGFNLTNFSTNYAIFSSTDSGTSWKSSGAGYVTSFAVSDSTLYAVGSYGAGGVLRRNISDTAWTRLAFPSNMTIRLCVAKSGDSLFVGGSGIDISINDGEGWSAANNGIPTSIGNIQIYVYVLAVGRENGAGTNIFAGTTSAGVFRSADNGMNWSPAGSGLPLNSPQVYSYPWINALTIIPPDIFAGTSDGVFRSSDNGSSWAAVNDGLTNTNITSLAVSGTNLVGGSTNGGVWKRPLSEIVTGVKSQADQTPNIFSLQQNYPNPFNPSTVITYQLPANILVTLKVYDELGRLVRTLVEDRETAGIHSATLNASNLSSGVYFYRLTAGSFVDTKKLMLLK